MIYRFLIINSIERFNTFRFNRSNTSMTKLKQVIQDFYRKERFGHNEIQLKAIQVKQEVQV